MISLASPLYSSRGKKGGQEGPGDWDAVEVDLFWFEAIQCAGPEAGVVYLSFIAYHLNLPCADGRPLRARCCEARCAERRRPGLSVSVFGSHLNARSGHVRTEFDETKYEGTSCECDFSTRKAARQRGIEGVAPGQQRIHRRAVMQGRCSHTRSKPLSTIDPVTHKSQLADSLWRMINQSRVQCQTDCSQN